MEVDEIIVIGALDDDLAVLYLRRDAVMHRIGELAELPLHRHLPTRDRGRDAIRELDGFLTDSRRTSPPCVRGTFLTVLVLPLQRISTITIPDIFRNASGM